MMQTLARLRVPLGFACAVIAYYLAAPTWATIWVGGLVALPGEAVRVWASGHIDKGREVTRSGPYRFVRHPLYLGSAILAAGFIIAAHSLVAGLLVVAYMAATLVAAMKTEEAVLDQRFSGEYAAYREGRAAPVDRPFQFSRVVANREYRAVAGFALAMGLLVLRMLV
jgi:protein-S-isoprenylcysteine O-methyltransferase Ste14